jgi:hypothetical protein
MFLPIQRQISLQAAAQHKLKCPLSQAFSTAGKFSLCQSNN